MYKGYAFEVNPEFLEKHQKSSLQSKTLIKTLKHQNNSMLFK
jgi:hypothetical protein